MNESREHPVDRYTPLAAGLLRLDPPPRRLSGLRRLQIVDAGVQGRPTPRRVSLAILAFALASTVLAPDWLYSQHPVVEAELISPSLQDLPAPLGGLNGVLPEGTAGHAAIFRLPSGDVRSGPISGDEYRELLAGRTTLDVHVMGSRGEHGRPVSGLFQILRLASAGLLAFFGVLAGLAALASLRRGWWMVRLARHGVAVVGRINEAKSQRLVRGDRPDGRRYDLYYDFRADGQVREGVVAGFFRRTHVPFPVDGPVRILYLPDAPHRSIPADLLPLARRDG